MFFFPFFRSGNSPHPFPIDDALYAWQDIEFFRIAAGGPPSEYQAYSNKERRLSATKIPVNGAPELLPVSVNEQTPHISSTQSPPSPSPSSSSSQASDARPIPRIKLPKDEPLSEWELEQKKILTLHANIVYH